LLHETKLGDDEDSFAPIGFGENRNELLYFDRYEGRTALFSMDLTKDNKTRLVYANPSFDLAGVQEFGKHRRLVAAGYADDRPRLHFFDSRMAQIREAIGKQFQAESVSVIDEDWSQTADRPRAIIGPTISSCSFWPRMATQCCKATTADPQVMVRNGSAKADFAIGGAPSATSMQERITWSESTSQTRAGSVHWAGATAAMLR
jgi:hypothetical protein